MGEAIGLPTVVGHSYKGDFSAMVYKGVLLHSQAQDHAAQMEMQTNMMLVLFTTCSFHFVTEDT